MAKAHVAGGGGDGGGGGVVEGVGGGGGVVAAVVGTCQQDERAEVSRASQDEVGLPKIFAEDPRLNPIRQHR